MKICYIDESGTGDEAYAVMAGLVVDTYRIGTAKKEWDQLLDRVSKLAHRPVREIHMRDFYSGKGAWYGSNGNERAAVVEDILNWIKERRHSVIFYAIDKNKYEMLKTKSTILQELSSIWCALAYQMILILQKHNQKMEKGKGRTLVIFDNEETERKNFNKMIASPFSWSDTYYNKGKKQERLDIIIDVPYWGDSEEVGLLQVADVIAFIVRRYCELNNGTKEKFNNERNLISSWNNKINETKLCVIFPKKGRCDCANTFWDIAPDCLKCY